MDLKKEYPVFNTERCIMALIVIGMFYFVMSALVFGDYLG